MIRIAICDDDNSICNQLEDILEHYAKDNNYRFEIEVFYSGERLIEFMKSNEHFDLIFLDIEMEEMDGIEVGQFIRNDFKNYTTEILYVSGTSTYYRKLFEVQPLNFIAKPFQTHTVISNIDLALTRMRKNKQYFKYQKGNEYFTVRLDDILYFSSYKRKIEMYTTTYVDSFYGKLNDVLSTVPKRQFVQISRSVIINHHHVTAFKYSEVTLSNGITLPIPVSKRPDVRNFQMQKEWG